MPRTPPRSVGSVLVDRQTWGDLREVLGWLFSKDVWKYRRQISWILAASVIQTVCQAGAFVMLVQFVASIEADWTFRFASLEYSLRESAGLVFAVFALLMLAVLALGAVFGYFARRWCVRLARIYEEDTLRLVSEDYIRQFRYVHSPSGCEDTREQLQQIYSRAGRYLGRALMDALQTMVPFATMLVCLGVLFWMEPILTGILLGLSLLALPFHLWVAASGVAAGHVLTSEARQSTLDRVAFLDAVRFQTTCPHPDTPLIKELVTHSPASSSFLDAYEVRLKVGALSQVFGRGTQALMMLVVLVYFASPVITGDVNFTTLLFYFVVLRFFGTGLQNTMTTLIMLHVFHMYFESYLSLRRRWARQVAEPERADLPATRNFDLRVGSPPTLRLERGQPLGVVSPVKVAWSSVAWLLHALFGGNSARTATLVQSSAIFVAVRSVSSDDLHEMLGVDRSFSVERFIERFPGAEKFSDILRNALDAAAAGTWRRANWRTIPPPCQLLCAVFGHAQRGPADFVLVDGSVWTQVLVEQRRQVLDLLADSYVLTFYSAPPEARDLHFTEHFVFMAEDGGDHEICPAAEASNRSLPGSQRTRVPQPVADESNDEIFSDEDAI